MPQLARRKSRVIESGDARPAAHAIVDASGPVLRGWPQASAGAIVGAARAAAGRSRGSARAPVPGPVVPATGSAASDGGSVRAAPRAAHARSENVRAPWRAPVAAWRASDPRRAPAPVDARAAVQPNRWRGPAGVFVVRHSVPTNSATGSARWPALSATALRALRVQLRRVRTPKPAPARPRQILLRVKYSFAVPLVRWRRRFFLRHRHRFFKISVFKIVVPTRLS